MSAAPSTYAVPFFSTSFELLLSTLPGLYEKHVLPRGELEFRNGKVVPFLFDSGSQCSLIKETVSLPLDGNRKHDVISLKGLGEHSVLCTLQILTVVKIHDL